MRGVVRIAYRNTRRQTKRVVMLGGAIAFGVMIITLLNAFTSGAVGNIKNNFSYAVGGHIFVSGAELTPNAREVGRIGDDSLLMAAIQEGDPRIVSIHRRSAAFGSLIFGSKTVSHRIEGVDFAAETDLSKGLELREGSLDQLLDDPRALILPASAAEKLGVMAGETVLVRLQTVTGQQNVGEFLVVAIIEDAASFGMASAYAGLAYLNELIGLEPTEYQMFNVFLRDMKDIDAIAHEIYESLASADALVERPFAEVTSHADFEEAGVEAFGSLFGQAAAAIVEEPWDGTKFSIMTLNELMQPIVAAMTILDGIALGIFVILLVITAVGITNTFRMVILERTREIGAMRAFGMQRATVRKLFLWEAAIISLGGGAVGLSLAALIAAVVSRLTFSSSQGLELFLNNGHVTFAVTPANLIVNVATLLLICLFAALFPANSAAKLEPVKALGGRF